MIELTFYLILAIVMGAIVRVLKSIKSGLFYNIKRKEKIHPKLEKYYKNLHFISSPSNYLQQGIYFLLIFAICRLIQPEITFLNLSLSLLSAFLIAIGQSTIASYWWQVWINRGSGLPDVDPNENHKSEFAVGNKSFWFNTPKFLNGKNSKYLPFIGSIEIVAGIVILNYLFNI